VIDGGEDGADKGGADEGGVDEGGDIAGVADEVDISPLPSYDVEVCVKNSAVQCGITGIALVYVH
jgi:hypothetical protein